MNNKMVTFIENFVKTKSFLGLINLFVHTFFCFQKTLEWWGPRSGNYKTL